MFSFVMNEAKRSKRKEEILAKQKITKQKENCEIAKHTETDLVLLHFAQSKKIVKAKLAHPSLCFASACLNFVYVQ